MLNDNPFRVFVYGPHKRGEANFIEMVNARFEGEDMTAQPAFVMHEFASLKRSGSIAPGIIQVDDQRGGYIEGEVFTVTAEFIAKLDTLHGVGRGIFKRLRNVPLKSGKLADMYMRVATGNIVAQPQFVHFDANKNTYKWIQKNAHRS